MVDKGSSVSAWALGKLGVQDKKISNLEKQIAILQERLQTQCGPLHMSVGHDFDNAAPCESSQSPCEPFHAEAAATKAGEGARISDIVFEACALFDVMV